MPGQDDWRSTCQWQETAGLTHQGIFNTQNAAMPCPAPLSAHAAGPAQLCTAAAAAWLISPKPCFPVQPAPVPRQGCFFCQQRSGAASFQRSTCKCPHTQALACVMYRLTSLAVLSQGQQFSHLSPIFSGPAPAEGSLVSDQDSSLNPAPIHCLPTPGDCQLTALCVQCD